MKTTKVESIIDSSLKWDWTEHVVKHRKRNAVRPHQRWYAESVGPYRCFVLFRQLKEADLRRYKNFFSG